MNARVTFERSLSSYSKILGQKIQIFKAGCLLDLIRANEYNKEWMIPKEAENPADGRHTRRKIKDGENK